MNPIFRNILGLVVGIVAGMALNGGIVSLNGVVIDLPEGYDYSTSEKMVETFHLLQPVHLIIPFIAHALGSLLGGFLVARIAATYKMVFALMIGTLFLSAGTYLVIILPSPLWFNVLDLTLAYIPMAYLGAKLGGAK